MLELKNDRHLNEMQKFVLRCVLGTIFKSHNLNGIPTELRERVSKIKEFFEANEGSLSYTEYCRLVADSVIRSIEKAYLPDAKEIEWPELKLPEKVTLA